MTSTSQRGHQSAFNPYPNPRSSNVWNRSQAATISVTGEQQQWVQKSRRNSNQFHAMTGPTGTNGHYPTPKAQPEARADLALHSIPASGVDSHLSSSTVFETGMTTSGHQASHTGEAQSTRSRHGRKGSNTGRVHLVSKVNASQMERGSDRTKRRLTTRPSTTTHHTVDVINHMNTTSTTAATQTNVGASLFWNNGRNMGDYHPGNNSISETRSVQSPYTHDAGRADMASYFFPTDHQAPPEGTGTGFAASGIQANEHPLSADIGAARHYSPNNSPYSTLGSLQQQPAPPISDQSISEANMSSQANTINYPYPTRYVHPQDNFNYMISFPPNHLSQSPPASFPQTLSGYDSGYPLAEPFLLTPNSPPSSSLPIPSSHYSGYGSFRSPAGASPDPVMLDTHEKSYAYSQPGHLPVHSQPFIASPLHHPSPPSDNSSEGERAVSPSIRRQSNIRHPGQRVDVDQQFLDGSFNDADGQSRVRRAILDDIQRQPWFLNHEKEPQIESRNDPFSRGLGTVGRSIYTVFLVEDKESNQWRCLFGGDNNTCKKADKRFERVERAIEHIRSHLGHRPFSCDGSCLKSQTTSTPCGKRFFASGYLEDHKKRPQKRTSGTQH